MGAVLPRRDRRARPLVALGALVVLLTLPACSLPVRAAAPLRPSLPRFTHVFVVVEEDRSYGEVIGRRAAPFVNALAARSALATDYHALVHPGYGDYFALTAGDLLGAPSHCTPEGCSTGAQNIADRLDEVGRTWRAYMDGMPSPCEAGSSGTYEAQHDIFLYFNDIRDNAQRCNSGVVPIGRLGADLETPRKAPAFIWIEPSGCHTMETCQACDSNAVCAVSAGDAWLNTTLSQVFSSNTWKAGGCVLFLTWEEDDFTPANRVATIVTGAHVRAGYKSAVRYNHYSLLRTIELIWGLRPFTSSDANAPPLTDMFEAA